MAEGDKTLLDRKTYILDKEFNIKRENTLQFKKKILKKWKINSNLLKLKFLYLGRLQNNINSKHKEKEEYSLMNLKQN